jgi:hypothetical protein
MSFLRGIFFDYFLEIVMRSPVSPALKKQRSLGPAALTKLITLWGSFLILSTPPSFV